MDTLVALDPATQAIPESVSKYPLDFKPVRKPTAQNVIKFLNNYPCAIDRAAVLNKILFNGECGCRGEDGNQSRLNASANLERPVLNRPFGFLAT